MIAPGDPDVYRAIEDGPEVEHRVKGSRFLGQVLSVPDEAAARARRAAIRRRHHDATHHCSAWRLGVPGTTLERFDDDGEPSGTGGRPILALLAARDLYATAVVVTRWFGGTKLGTGGLARAYGEAAARALDAATTVERVLTTTVEVRLAFDDVGVVEAVLARAGADVPRVERHFDPAPLVRLTVRRSRAERWIDALVEATGGRARIASTNA